MPTKYIFVTGGVVSSLGKGLAAASIGWLLEARGFRVTLQKLDPYINVDPGTMSPYQHGEVFVTDDGAETDLDLGHYERFTHARMTRDQQLHRPARSTTRSSRRSAAATTSARTVQVIPHITDEIKARIRECAEDVDVLIVEIGGTVGDIEALPFLEAIRQLAHDVGRENVLYIHLTLVPYIAAAGELKTKPTQHSREGAARDRHPARHPPLPHRPLPAAGDQGEDRALLQRRRGRGHHGEGRRDDLRGAARASTRRGSTRSSSSCSNIWTGAAEPRRAGRASSATHQAARAPDGADRDGRQVRRADRDSYKSLNEALDHGGIANDARVETSVRRLPRSSSRTAPAAQLDGATASSCRAASASAASRARSQAIRYAREQRRAVLRHLPRHAVRGDRVRAQRRPGSRGANSTEFDPSTPHPVIDLLPEQRGDRGQGRHDAPRRLPVRAAPRTRWRAQAYGETRRSRSATATATSSTNEYRELLEKRASCSRACRPTSSSSRSSSCPTTPGSSAASSTPSSSRARCAPHPLFVGFVGAALRHGRR